ncbi:MAG: TPM domain-containing protein [Treponemataceae bacterium]|nr:TPM domain-containing protein [Treponemataceae bacterium]
MKINKYFVSILLSLFFASSIFALSVPNLTSPIVDNANLISDGVEQNINNQLEDLSDSTGIQLAVLTIPTLEGEVLESYSMKVAETWELGSVEKDTGVLLLIALEERSIRIEVGYGLEGVLTDTKCGLIIRNVIAPEFRNGNYQAGIVNAVNNMVGLVKGDESLVSKRVLNESSGDSGAFIFMGVVLLYGFIFVMAVISSKKRGPRTGTGTRTTPYVHHIPRNFGGGGGGGFSGGGGSFGGGGASGGW